MPDYRVPSDPGVHVDRNPNFQIHFPSRQDYIESQHGVSPGIDFRLRHFSAP